MEYQRQVLQYPGDEKDLIYAIEGYWQPKILAIDEQKLAKELVGLMEEEIDHHEQDDKYDDNYSTEMHIVKEQFDFLAVVNYTTYIIGGENRRRFIRVHEIDLFAHFDNNELLIKWNNERLISEIESQIIVGFQLR